MAKRKTQAAKEVADEVAQVDAEARAEAAQAEAKLLRRQLKQLRRAHGDALEFNDYLRGAISALGPLKRPKAAPMPKGGSDVAMVLLLGDWHIGEVIQRDEMDGFNEYNWETAQQRMAVLGDKALRWLAVARRGYRVQRLYVAVLGDMIQGEIHPEEYLPTNEFTVPVAIAKAGHLLAETLTRFTAEFREVRVDMIGADNHGRRTFKPQAKEAARNSYNYLVYEIARQGLTEQQHLDFRLHLPLKAQVDIEAQSVLMEHGHTTRAWMGIPFYGIERGQGREARKRMMRGRPFDLHIMGHWHIAAELPGLIINGSLCGATEYDAMVGRFAWPSQTSMLFHHKWGPFSRIAWRLNDGTEDNGGGNGESLRAGA